MNSPFLQEKVAFASTVGPKASHPFMNGIIPSAPGIAHENDLYASVMMAQSILESGWGTSRLGSAPNYNLFGIKGDYQGNTVNMPTLEDSGGQSYYAIQANFRKYPSYKESLEDYAALLRAGTKWDPYFYSGAWKSNAQSYTDATAYLTGRYATDTAYGTKLNGIIEKNNLTAYDTPAAPVRNEMDVKASHPIIPVPTVASAKTGTTYLVVNGDTLWGIAAKHGVSLQDLREWNQLDGELIHPGQKIAVKTGQVQNAALPAPVAPAGKVLAQDSYQVQNGDTLWSISHKQGMAVSQLMQANQLSAETIYPGQVLRVVQASGTQAVAKAPAQSSWSKQVTVGTGDTLYSLADRAGVSLQELKSANDLQSDLIHPGQTLLVPGQSASGEAKTASPNQADLTVTYQIQKDDTLYSIANRSGISVSELKAANGLQGETIQVGQSLKLQINNAKADSTAPGGTYQVQKGDTLYSIANRSGISVSELKAANGLQGETIHVGQSLKLQAGSVKAEKAIPSSIQVQKDDTLYSLARKHGVSLERLMQWNGLASTAIYPGQTLRIQ